MNRLALVTTVVLAACGGTPAATTTPAEGPATAALPNVPFEQLDHDQQIQFMKEKVVPAMKPLFQKHDAVEYAEFGCKTCHGEGAEKGEFEMPFAGLPQLDFADLSKFDKADLEWMGTVIKPEMAALLGESEYTPENPTGFGCLHCHTAAGK